MRVSPSHLPRVFTVAACKFEGVRSVWTVRTHVVLSTKDAPCRILTSCFGMSKSAATKALLKRHYIGEFWSRAFNEQVRLMLQQYYSQPRMHPNYRRGLRLLQDLNLAQHVRERSQEGVLRVVEFTDELFSCEFAWHPCEFQARGLGM